MKRHPICPNCLENLTTPAALQKCPGCGLSLTVEADQAPRPTSTSTEVGSRFGCPNCKSEVVSELNIVDVLLPVNRWDERGDPVDFGTWRTVDDTISTKQSAAIVFEQEPRYHCEDCDHEFDTPERLEAA